MCLIAHKPIGSEFPERLRASTFSKNRDGFGAMYSLGDGRVHVFKFLPKTVADIDKILEDYTELDASFHWRWRTHGYIDLENVHPYEVLNRDEDGLDVFLMHNGVLSCVNEVDESKSDTWHFIQGFLRPLVKTDPDILNDPTFQTALGKMIGTGNKFCIYRGDQQEPIIINKNSGVSGDKYNKCWLSNTYAYTDPQDAPVTRTYGYYGGNYGRWFEDEEDWDTLKKDLTKDEEVKKGEVVPFSKKEEIPPEEWGLQDLVGLSYEELLGFIAEEPQAAADILWNLINE